MKSKEYQINEMLESIQGLMERFDESMSVGESSQKKKKTRPGSKQTGIYAEEEQRRNLDIIDISLPSGSYN